jgi:hypothetical protein
MTLLEKAVLVFAAACATVAVGCFAYMVHLLAATP